MIQEFRTRVRKICIAIFERLMVIVIIEYQVHRGHRHQFEKIKTVSRLETVCSHAAKHVERAVSSHQTLMSALDRKSIILFED